MASRPIGATRSGAPFSPWHAPIEPPARFDFEHLLEDGFARQDLNQPDSDLEDPFGGSPLSSPDPSPPASPAVPPTELPEYSRTPLCMPSDTKPAVAVGKRTHSKAQGHENRRLKRRRAKETQAPGRTETRPAASKKHVRNSEPTASAFNSEGMPIASTGYIGIRESRSGSIYQLKQLAGDGSALGFRLHKWDGRHVRPLRRSLAADSLLGPPHRSLTVPAASSQCSSAGRTTTPGT